MTKKLADQPLWPVVQETLALSEGSREPGKTEHSALPLASAYAEYRQKRMEISNRENEAALENTVAGRLGRLLERVTRAIGFDYRINVALLGGFVAKEVIVSTLGTAYSLGSVDAGESGLCLRQAQERSPMDTAAGFHSDLVYHALRSMLCNARCDQERELSEVGWLFYCF